MIKRLNFNLGLAWCCMELEIQCTVFTPDTAPEIKLNAIRSYGASVVKVDYVESLKTIHIANDYIVSFAR